MSRPGVSLAFLAALLALAAADAGAAGLLVPRGGSAPIEVKSHRVVAEVTDGLARTTLRQTFVNPHGRPLEAIYIFPVPEGAALTAVAMETGGKRFEGLLAERRKARRIYDRIVRRREDPALVEQIGRATFRLSVFPVLPDKDTVIEMTWVEHIPVTQGVLRYVYPLSLVEGAAARTRHDFTFSITLRSSARLAESAPAASLPKGTEVVRKSDHEVRASFEKMRIRLDRDVELAARIVTGEPRLDVTTFRREGGDGWFLAIVTPPAVREEDLVPRDVLLLLDTSGSMRGEKLEQAKAAALYLLRNLRPGDRVNLVRFSSEVEAYADAPVPASLSEIAKLTDFVQGFRAAGGTALGDALRDIRGLPEAEGRVRTVVLITDGLPTVGETEPAKILGFAKEAGEKGLRIFTFGVGRDVDPSLLRGVSRASRGRAEIFGPEAQLQTRLQVFLDRTSSPVLANVVFGIEDLRTYGVFPRPIPDAYLGEQIVLVGRYRDGGERTVKLSADLGRERKLLERKVVFRKAAGGSPAVAQLAAIQNLSFLEESLRLRLGLSDSAYYAALDRGAYETKDEIIAEMIRVSLEHGVQCPYTSFLVLLPEDRLRLDPRDVEAAAAAMQRLREARAKLAPDFRTPERPKGAPEAESMEASRYGDRTAGPGEVEGEGSGGSEGAGAGYGFGRAPGNSGAPSRPADPAPKPRPGPLTGRDGGGRVGTPRETEPAEPEMPAFFARRQHRHKIARGPDARKRSARVDSALGWLAKAQQEDGRWSAGKADDYYDVGVTGLAVLAFLGAGERTAGTKHSHTVVRGLSWLMVQQDGEGCFGMRKTNHFTFNHAIAAQAVCEAYGISRSGFLKSCAQRGLDFIAKCQNPYLAWRYGVRPKDNDTSVTAWMLFALKCGKEAGLRTEQACFDGTKAWLEKATEPEYGRVGYTSRGSGPSRSQDLMDKFPSDKVEPLTAAGILCRVFLGEQPRKSEMIQKGADLMLKTLPWWDEHSGSIDMYYWYFGTLAMWQVGGDSWSKWAESVHKAVTEHQHVDGEHAGSWDPVGPWCPEGGRVYATALLTMVLEAEYLYPRQFPPGGRKGAARRFR